MKITHADEAAALLRALPKIDKEQAECLAHKAPKVVLDELYLPPKVWAEILTEARGIVLKRLAKLGVKVEP